MKRSCRQPAEVRARRNAAWSVGVEKVTSMSAPPVMEASISAETVAMSPCALRVLTSKSCPSRRPDSRKPSITPAAASRTSTTSLYWTKKTFHFRFCRRLRARRLPVLQVRKQKRSRRRTDDGDAERNSPQGIDHGTGWLWWTAGVGVSREGQSCRGSEGHRAALEFRMSRNLDGAMSSVMFPQQRLAEICQRHGIRRLSLFGSTLRGTDRPDSDVDLLVEFQPEKTPGLLGLAHIELELSALLSGRKVDLRTPEDLSRYFRDDVTRTAEVQYAAH